MTVIVTDRDTALRALGSPLPASDPPLRALLGNEPAVLPMDASVEDAAKDDARTPSAAHS